MRSRPTTVTSQIKNRTEKLVLVRESIFYGLAIENAKVDKTSINRGIVSTPNIVFYSNNSKCLIDYTNQTNSQIEKNVEDYFSQLARGVTLNLINGNYSDVNSSKIADLTGTYIFRSYYNGIIEADVTSVQSLSTTINRYDKNKFENIPYIFSQEIIDGPIQTLIKNKFGKNTKNSFNYLGIKVGDYIKLTDLETPVKITEINIDSDGNEYIIFDGVLEENDLTNKKTKVELYIPVSDEFTILPNLNDTLTGACVEYFNNVIISCADNHTFSQCRFRSSKDKNINSEFTVGTFCSTPETDKAIQKDTTDNLVQLSNVLATVVSNMNAISGPILKNGNSKNSFYGRPF